MFKFLKEKLKSAISKISEGVEKEGKAEEAFIEEEKGFFARLKDKFASKDEAVSKEEIRQQIEPKKEKESKAAGHKSKEPAKPKEDFKKHETRERHETKEQKEAKEHIKQKSKEAEKIDLKPEVEEDAPKATEHETAKEKTESYDEKIQPSEKKAGFFQAIKEKIITTKINDGQFERLFWDLELALMENNVAIEVVEKIKKDLKEALVEKPIRRTKVEETIQQSLKSSIEGLFENGGMDLIEEIKGKSKKPYVIAFFGINGSGKTTSIAKVASMLKDKKVSCVLAASDTFRAASIEQLQIHADKIGIKMIRHDYGSDPAAVAFDAIKHAKAKNIDAVLIDTAGRMHSNQNLIDEMKKIIRVANPDLKIFVGESITGNDCVEQAKTFNEAVGIDGIILAKADVDEKGGAAISVSYVTKKPILYLGTGQEYKDLEKFNEEKVMKGLGFA